MDHRPDVAAVASDLADLRVKMTLVKPMASVCGTAIAGYHAELIRTGRLAPGTPFPTINARPALDGSLGLSFTWPTTTTPTRSPRRSAPR
jgi:hypothetical protein